MSIEYVPFNYSPRTKVTVDAMDAKQAELRRLQQLVNDLKDFFYLLSIADGVTTDNMRLYRGYIDELYLLTYDNLDNSTRLKELEKEARMIIQRRGLNLKMWTKLGHE